MNHTPVLIAFGSNIEPESHLTRAVTRLHALLGIEAISTVYRTRALRMATTPDDAILPDFLNGALSLRPPLDPLELRQLLKRLEQEAGRQPGQPGWVPRPLDLDIALMGGLQWNTPGLTIPDPEIPTRPFLAIPLAELAPGLSHPALQQPLQQIAAGFAPQPAEMCEDLAMTTTLRRLLRPASDPV